MPISQKTKNQIFIDYIPAQISNGKICRIYYYAKNPGTQKLERFVIKCNRMKSKSENLRLAKKICAEVNDNLREGWNPFYERMTSGEWVSLQLGIEKFIASKEKELRADSMRSYRSVVLFFLQWLKNNNLEKTAIVAFTRRHAERFLLLISNKDGVSSRTYNNYLRMLRTLFNHFIERDYIKENPFDKFTMKRIDEKMRETIPVEDRAKIKDYFMKNNVPFYYIMLLCYRCLIRPKEILMLKIKYVDFKNKMLKIPASVAKNHNERTIALHDDMVDFLLPYKDLNGELYIFSTNYMPGKKLLNTRDSGRTWANMRKDLNMPPQYQFYSLKDTGITEMLESGVPAKLVKELADHHSLEMTEKYTHKSSAKKILEYNNLEF